MSKAVLISIRPEWVIKILSGEKTLEIRKTRPKLETPFRCYIYECGGKVVGEFVCDNITNIVPISSAKKGHKSYFGLSKYGWRSTCLTPDELIAYGGEYKRLYGWHISDLIIYDKPKELSEFLKYGYDDALAVTNWENLHCIGINGIGGSIKSLPMPNKDDYKLTRPPQSWCYVEKITCTASLPDELLD